MLFALRTDADALVFDAINPSFETNTGLSNAEVAGRALEEVSAPGIWGMLSAGSQHCLSASEPAVFVEAMPLPTGLRYWLTSLRPAAPAGGAAGLILGRARYVNERAQARVADLPNSRRFSAAKLGAHIWFTALPGGAPDFLSPYFFAYTGLKPGVAAGQIQTLVHQDDIARLATMAEVQTDCTVDFDARLRRHDGVYRWFRVRAELTEGLAGRRWYGVATDIDDAPMARAGMNGCGVVTDRAWRITSLTPKADGWTRRVEPSDPEVISVNRSERRSFQPQLIDAAQGGISPAHASRSEIPSVLEFGRSFERQARPIASGQSVLFPDASGRILPRHATRLANDLFEGMGEAVTAAMIVFDERGVVVSLNAAARESLGLHDPTGVSEPLGAPYVEVCRKLVPDLEEMALRRGLGDLIGARAQSFTHTCIGDGPVGLRWRRVRITRATVGMTECFIAVHEDLTDAAQIRGALRATTEQLATAQQDERRRIAMELHDSTSQHLVALRLGLAKLERLVGKEPGTQDVFEDMERSVREAIEEIRVFSFLTYPAELERDGLEATARSFVRGFGWRTGLDTSFRAEGGVDAVGAAASHTAFRLIQEALSNVYRHAHAACVDVELANIDGVLTLRVADNGDGIGPLTAGDCEATPLGVGITGMRARVAQFGGALDISGNGAGTVVTARIPPPAATDFPGPTVSGPNPF
jgi:signal transduction histidine kinase